MMKYTTKLQNNLENAMAIHLQAFDKSVVTSGNCDDPIS